MYMKKLLLFVLFSTFIFFKSNCQLLSKSESFQHNKDSGAYTSIEVYAEFPGGVDGWTRYLTENLNNNVPIKNGAPEGKYSIISEFIIDKSGNLVDIKFLTNPGYGMTDEIKRVLTKSPKWRPANQNLKNIRSFRTQKFTFDITNRPG